MNQTDVRFNVRQMIDALAVLALVIRFPLAIVVLVEMVIALAFWLPFVVLMVYLTDLLGRARVGVAVVGGLSLLPFACISWGFHDEVSLLLALTPLNFAGPVCAAQRVWHRKPLLAGGILWAWQGVLWSTFMCSASMVDLHPHDAFRLLLTMAGGTLLTLIVAVLLAVYGARPLQPRLAWAHYFGWGLVECDVIFWGLFTAGFFRWIHRG